MNSDTKNEVNTNRILPSEENSSLEKSIQRDEFFEKEWDELLIRFDRTSRKYVVRTISGSTEEQMAEI